MGPAVKAFSCYSLLFLKSRVQGQVSLVIASFPLFSIKGVTGNGQVLALWRYSVVRQPLNDADKVQKMILTYDVHLRSVCWSCCRLASLLLMFIPRAVIEARLMLCVHASSLMNDKVFPVLFRYYNLCPFVLVECKIIGIARN